MIDRLREGVSVNTDVDIQADIEEQYAKIDTARDEIDKLRSEKFVLESEARKLEAEVGPVKYLADIIYGEQANRNTLEEAVRWVILLLVAVFDPLAVIMVLAGVSTVERYRNKNETKEPAQTEVEEKQDTNSIGERKAQKEVTVPESSNVEVTTLKDTEAAPSKEYKQPENPVAEETSDLPIQDAPVETKEKKPTKAIRSITVKKIQ